MVLPFAEGRPVEALRLSQDIDLRNDKIYELTVAADSILSNKFNLDTYITITDFSSFSWTNKQKSVLMVLENMKIVGV